ncbi:MAG: TIGR01212 family radical SAM protein [Spirochaetaceae bacterium]|nr:TIGR01212 family radical SAM protein [Spirochaetaceae bacterium]
MHFYSVSEFYKKIFGCKAYKIAIDAGCTCPTRDGTKGTGGCTFCSASGSGDFASSRKLSIIEQIEDAKRLVGSKCPGGDGAQNGVSRDSGGSASCGTYIAYFQNFTNTYGDPDALESKYLEACSAPNVSGIAIATRPDCLSDDILRRIADIAEKKFVQLELGFQTADEKSAEAFRRGFTNDVYVDAVRRIKAASSRIHVVTHVILGLPGETLDTMLSTTRFCARAGTDGIKLSLLHVLLGTDMARDYERGLFSCMEKDEYFSVLSAVLESLPPDMVIHRLTGDGAKRLLIAPMWTADKKRVWNDMMRWFADHDVQQGRAYKAEQPLPERASQTSKSS